MASSVDVELRVYFRQCLIDNVRGLLQIWGPCRVGERRILRIVVLIAVDLWRVPRRKKFSQPGSRRRMPWHSPARRPQWISRAFGDILKHFYSKSKEQLILNTCLHCISTGRVIGRCSADCQSLTAFHTLFGKGKYYLCRNTKPWVSRLMCDSWQVWVLTMELTPHLSVYSTMFELKHSQIVVDDGMQWYMQEHAAYDDKQENAACNDKQELQHRGLQRHTKK